MLCSKVSSYKQLWNNLLKYSYFRQFRCTMHSIEFENECDENQEPKSEYLMLYDTYAREKKKVMINDEPISYLNQNNNSQIKILKMYCCGPTVYDDCHLGHALTYIRCDLLRRAYKNYCGIRVLMAMGITDIDDKILNKAKEMNQTDFTVISKTYTTSFMKDMESLHIIPADCYLKVTDHINDIINFISYLQANDCAYISETGDVNFDSNNFCAKFNIEKLWYQDEHVTDKSLGKKSPRDFALWKSSKPNEPSWDYVNPCSGGKIVGRPGMF